MHESECSTATATTESNSPKYLNEFSYKELNKIYSAVIKLKSL